MSDKKRVPYLLDEPPISFYPSLAKALKNPNMAIILQQLHFLLNSAKISNNTYVNVDGKWWVYNSYAEWQEKYFTWLGQSTIKSLFGFLESKNIVISKQGVKDKLDRRKWYTIDYDAFAEYLQCIGQNLAVEHELDSSQSDGQDLADVNRKSKIPSSKKKGDTRKSANTPPKSKSQKPLPANRKNWQWEHIERYAVENPGIDELAMLDDQAMRPTLKQLPTKAIALDCIELYEEMERNGCEDYSGLWLRTTFKPEYSTFKCMLWALPKYLKKDTPQPSPKSGTMIENLRKMGIKEINGKAI